MTKELDIFEEILNPQSKYCYPGTDVLINKLDIKNREILERVERDYSTYRLSQIYLRTFTGNFDIQHYLDIHKYVFEDIYEFAGKIRNENISKGGVPFCRNEFIYPYLKETLMNMKKDLSKVNDKETLLTYLAHYYGELDIIHPFREGNGRVQREFFRQYMEYIREKKPFLDYKIEYSRWTKEDKQRLIEGCILSAKTGDKSILREVLAKVIVKVKEKEYKRRR
ncbi:MAG: cell filamentation protein Fic [Mollicutes bacterium]|nr:cell filamentation protein Fic [Mollicutes bacterium]